MKKTVGDHGDPRHHNAPRSDGFTDSLFTIAVAVVHSHARVIDGILRGGHIDPSPQFIFRGGHFHQLSYGSEVNGNEMS